MLQAVCHLARKAGDAIMHVYNGQAPLHIREKANHSPVTTADMAAHHVIMSGLQQLTPRIPILSEEEIVSWEVRKTWKKYWLVDPLDGTKEFIKRNGEFTVNIALINQGKPILGVVYAPVFSTLYSAIEGRAWKEHRENRIRIQVKPLKPPVVVISRSHSQDDQLSNYLNTLGCYHMVKIGSSLKFCMVAEGEAQFYVRLGSTNIWDTGAGHAIALAAGATVSDWKGKTINYTPKISCLNSGFLVSATKDSV
ncbi:3'(2'),5'-bisphosphate nucleotidase CysQ [Candidatus Erwinia haradaeae]|uniref:3'(2'),5'-bisphosphate nucleotidase CysQ n=1 Tax=Candidatus Erwinia haradaeae TaxID=1922217 RepID=A0A451DLN9_9GAMM|nr:3'(2'),5'-bisphosphate nucleotidase CysQ [Candidatus Erwinia haradaeae]VFP87663.1 3'(2'),5'-bisphosphate nucleotidase CysQ [Candidatus Erwinia haradaeae]